MTTTTPTTPTPTTPPGTTICGLQTCAKPFPSRVNGRGLQQQFCCHEHACAAKTEAALAEAHDKQCPICGDMFGIRDGERKERYDRRATCSKDCGNELGKLRRAENIPLPTCKKNGCDNQVSRRSRDYCSRSCSIADRANHRPSSRPPGESKAAIQRRHREKKKQLEREKQQKDTKTSVFGKIGDQPWRPPGWYQYPIPAGPQPRAEEVAA
jgi:hypothetical protein